MHDLLQALQPLQLPRQFTMLHWLLPAVLFVPVEHAAQALAVGCAPKRPAAHAAHATAPWPLYLPRGQSAQSAPVASGEPAFPAGHLEPRVA